MVRRIRNRIRNLVGSVLSGLAHALDEFVEAVFGIWD